ncbi:hypothetical protein T03_15365 [Trichinella britovi]|uniref:Uncharacterized protein n=1 Tax=Trichinella britovi TaxID=45882 RepID=A0A0V0YU57_TRIBR|nr:hypothetical protein T03_15365 [Trichinella britovi]
MLATLPYEEPPSDLHPGKINVRMLATLPYEEPPSALHPGKIKWIGHSV